MKKAANWKTVFGFTYRQIFNRKGFKISTFLGAFLIFVIVCMVCIISAAPDETEKSEITKVFVLDESDYMPADYAAYIQLMQNEQYSEVEFEYAKDGEGVTELLKKAAAEGNTLVLSISKNTDDDTAADYVMEAIITENSGINEDMVMNFLEDMLQYFEMNKLTQAGLTEQQLTQAIAPVITNVYELDESENLAAYLIKIFAPMIFGLLLYFMLLFHGQTICTEVSAEKTSKLMESLLTYCHPYALISGKVLAVTVLSVVQLIIWVAAAAAGLIGGGMIAGIMFEERTEPAMELVALLRENMGATAFSFTSIIMALIIFFVGLLFYNVLAGVAGSMVARPEDASSTQALFQFPVVISFIISYFAFLMDNRDVLAVIRYVPFTSPFCVPVELIMGSVGIFEGLISMMILLVFSVFIIALSAVIYKGLVLYNGQKVSMGTIINIFKNIRKPKKSEK